MKETVEKHATGQAWVMIFHQGLPVAVSPVMDRSSGSLRVAGDPLGLERNTPLVLQITPEGGSLGAGEWLAGVVEGSDPQQLRIRLKPGTPD